MTTNPTRKQRIDNTLDLFVGLAQQLKRPEKTDLSNWADKNVFLADTQASSVPGPWRTSFTPYLREIQNAVSDHTVEKVVVMSAARVGKTRVILHAIGYHMDYDPSPIMVVLPTIEIGEAFSTEKLAPFLRDTKCLRGMVPEPRSRDGKNTMKKKEFPGGFIVIAGGNSPASLSARDIKIACFDEVDRAPASAGTEGDPVELMITRTTTFGEGRGRKIILTSTPTVKGESRIEKAYAASTREEWCLPCPSCGEVQPLSWRQVHFDSLMHSCRECGSLHGKAEWLAGEGQWIARADSDTRGFHVNQLASPFVSWETLIASWREANEHAEYGDYELMKVFINTRLGESWEEPGARVDETGMMERREEYYAEVPDGVCALTIGVDTQDNRLCYEVVGWGAGKESWGLEYGELWGDPRVPGSPVWGLLDDVIKQKRRYASGAAAQLVCVCIDSGGHATDQVCSYAKIRQGWNVWAIKGMPGGGKLFIGGTHSSKVASATVFNLNVDAGKDEMIARLRVKRSGQGYCHFPRGGTQNYMGQYETVRGYDDRYFAGLTAEKRVAVKGKGGFERYEWVKQGPNEPWDCRNYAGAALVISKVNLGSIAEKAPWLNLPSEAARRPKTKPLNKMPMPPTTTLNSLNVGNTFTAV